MKNISVYFSLIFLWLLFQNISGFSQQNESKKSELKNNYDYAVFQIDNESFHKSKKLLVSETKNVWEVKYLDSHEYIIFNRLKKDVDSSIKTEDAEILKNKLNKLFLKNKDQLIWGYSIDKETVIFPSGKIYVLFDKSLDLEARKKRLSQIKNIKTKHFKDSVYIQKQASFNVWKGKEFIPDYLTENDLKKKPAIYTQHERKISVSSPFAVISLAKGKENEFLKMLETISLIKGVKNVSYGFHALGKNLHSLENNNEPPIVTDIVYSSLNNINRAWELFYPENDNYLSGFPNRFACSNNKVAVFDANFFNHPDIRQSIIGFDAFDHDNDPRTPIYPADINIYTDVSYPHGTFISGMIAGHKQSPGIYCGVSPGTYIVPFRSFAPETIDLSTREGTDDFIFEYGDDWWNALHKLWRISRTDDVSIANYSGATSEMLFEVSNLIPWFNFFLEDGNWENGIFFACSAGNNEASTTVAFPAKLASTYSVGWGNLADNEVMGNHGSKLDITVNDGKHPYYVPSGSTFRNDFNEGGTSFSCAVVSGTASLIKSSGTVMVDNKDEISSILKYSSYFSNEQLDDVTNEGFHNLFGYGFLDAFHAVKIAYKDYMRPLQVFKMNFLDNGSSSLIINAGFPSYSDNFANKPTGIYWCLKQADDDRGNYWKHLRLNKNTRHCEIVFDPISPMGRSIVGDFDGDNLDEIALQLGYWTENPEYSFIVKKFNNTNQSWEQLGNATETFPFVQIRFPESNRISQIISSNFKGESKDEIIALQKSFLNMAEYDLSSKAWKQAGEENFDLADISDELDDLLDNNFFTSLKIKKIRLKPFVSFSGKTTLLVLYQIQKKNRFLFWKKPKKYLVASLVYFDTVTNQFKFLPIDRDGKEQVIIKKMKHHETVFCKTGDYDGDGELEAFISTTSNINNVILINTEDNSLRSDNIILTKHISRILSVPLIVQSGDIDNDNKDEIIYLSSYSNNNKVKFLGWDPSENKWVESHQSLAHNRKNNKAIRIVVGDFNSDDYAEVGMLMEKPHKNIFLVYQQDGGVFKEFGLW